MVSHLASRTIRKKINGIVYLHTESLARVADRAIVILTSLVLFCWFISSFSILRLFAWLSTMYESTLYTFNWLVASINHVRNVE